MSKLLFQNIGYISKYRIVHAILPFSAQHVSVLQD